MYRNVVFCYDINSNEVKGTDKFMRKKISILITTFCIMLCVLVGCTSDTASGTEIRIACMKGPTAIGMIHMLSESDVGNTINQYTYIIAGTADEVSAGLVNGSLDVAAVPCNLASILYNKTEGDIVTVAVNTLGVLYIVEAGDTIQSVSDLKGKTLYSTGQGTTPEYTLRHLLIQFGLDPDKDVTIEYKSEATEVVAAMTQNPDAVAMLPQPYVTIAMNNNENLRIALDVTQEWENTCDSTVVTGVIVASKDFIEANPAAFMSFLEEYQASTEYANSNIAETAVLLEEYDVFKAAIATEAIPYCNVTYMDGSEMKEAVLDYLQVLYEQNPASVGGKAPEEGLFYINEADTD